MINILKQIRAFFKYVIVMEINLFEVHTHNVYLKNHAKCGYTESLKLIKNQEEQRKPNKNQEKPRNTKKNQEKPRKTTKKY